MAILVNENTRVMGRGIAVAQTTCCADKGVARGLTRTKAGQTQDALYQ